MSLLKLSPNFKPAFDGPKEASKLVSKLLKELPVVKVFLFGSSAEKKNTSDSDLDILVVVPNKSDVMDYYKVVNAPFFSPIATDWIFKTEDEFLTRKDLGGVCFIASRHGVLLYGS